MKRSNCLLVLLTVFLTFIAVPSLATGDDDSPVRGNGVDNHRCVCNMPPLSNPCKKECKMRQDKLAYSTVIAALIEQIRPPGNRRGNGVDNNRDCYSYPPRSAARKDCLTMSQGLVQVSQQIPTPDFFLVSCVDAQRSRLEQLSQVIKTSNVTNRSYPGAVRILDGAADTKTVRISGDFQNIYCPDIARRCTAESTDSHCGKFALSGKLEMVFSKTLLENKDFQFAQFDHGKFPGQISADIAGVFLQENRKCYTYPSQGQTTFGCQLPLEFGGALKVDAIFVH